ncbi:MBL fold metallo-hydrolase [Pigmentiphaga sp. D-2]|uniref:MBL fold metallo-hydrolase n=1 Tax=Pigmentiphaga sp. D-2 TaxID=1002116 RepID=UPI001FB7E047|nr:MBL fold metallo-hydrolase [Pigmentiphaga sp. D-2]
MLDKKRFLALGAAGVAGATLLAACGGSGGSSATPPDPLAKAPEKVLMTWFGITNWHYQIGDKGVLLDGEVVNGGRSPNVDAVTKAHKALTEVKDQPRSIDVILLGHIHPDHSIQIPEWAKQTGKTVYGPPAICNAITSYGLPAEQCVGLKGGEVIKLDEFSEIHAVRWNHSVSCGAFSNGVTGPETFGFLFVVQTRSGKKVNWYVSDSGAGGPDLTAPRVVTTTENGVQKTITYGSPIANLTEAMKKAGVTALDVWQGGPESRMVYQARTVVPLYGVKLFMPHHLNARAAQRQGFSLEYGMHYAYSEDDQPKLKEFLSTVGVPQVWPTNYFDAWTFDADGVKVASNAEMKAVYGLPATGPGPGTQYPNPRAGDLECDYD